MDAKVELPEGLKMCIPKALLPKRTPYQEPIFGVNLTSRHTIVDLHIDQGRDGLIQCLGKSKKIILMWPATDCNMRALQDSSCHQMKLFRVGQSLEDGIITTIDSSIDLVMFSGTIHVTITLESSMLVGINWVSTESHRPAIRCLGYEMDVELEGELSGILSIYVDQLAASLCGFDKGRHQEVLEDWIAVYPILVRRCVKPTKAERDQLDRLCQVFEGFFQRNSALSICCGSYTGSFEVHFRAVHLKHVYSLTRRDRKTSQKFKMT